MKDKKLQVSIRPIPKDTNPKFWDTNAHTILIMESLLRDATTPGEKFALRRALRIMRAIESEAS